MSGRVEEVAKTIKDIVDAGREVSGSRLALELQIRIPDWKPANAGCRSLRSFIATHVGSVVVGGRAGMDVVYTPEKDAATASLSPTETAGSPLTANLWRVWVSPNSPFALAVDKERRAVRIVPRKETVRENETLVEPPGSIIHRRFAGSFLTSVSPPLQTRLQRVLDSPSDTWWQQWLRELRNSEYQTAWSAFRQQKLQKLLEEALQNAGLDQPSIDMTLKVIAENHAAALSRSRRTSVDFAPVHDDDLRRLVGEVILRMNLSELRELRLPLGLVLDALETTSSR